MKTIAVMSDSHGRMPMNERLLQVLDECAYIFHLGDGLSDIDFLVRSYRGKVEYVYGNCDGGTGDKVVEIEGVKLLLTHGHAHGVKRDLHALSEAAIGLGCDYALYGHTHTPLIETRQGVTLINPGSIGYSGTYCYMVVTGNKAHAKIVQL